jgi:hypothetical protein
VQNPEIGNMIYKVNPKKSIFETNPGLDTNALFAACTDRELKYIFLVYDIEGPYAKMRLDDRKKKVAYEVGYKKERGGRRFDKNGRKVLNGSIAKVNHAITEFISIQKKANRNYSFLQAIDNQIEETLKFLQSEDSRKDAKTRLDAIKLAKDLKSLIETKLAIEALLGIELEETKEEAQVTHELSRLDEVNIERQDK